MILSLVSMGRDRVCQMWDDVLCFYVQLVWAEMEYVGCGMMQCVSVFS